jgi:hypothetical protein
MELHCPNCRGSVETSGAPGEARCPKCDTPLVEPSDTTAEPEGRDLLDDVLRDVRKIVHKEERTAKIQPPEPEAPGVFEKAPKPGRARPGPKLHNSVLIGLGVALVLGVAYLAFFMIQRGVAENRGQNVAIRATGILPDMRGRFEQAEKARVAQDYPVAAKAYVAALDQAEKINTILKGIPTNLGSGQTRERLLDIQTEALKVIRESEEALETPEIKFGGMNLVEVDGQWVTVADRDLLNVERMKAEGRQLHDGEWLTEAEIRERKGEVLYAGKWITREQYGKLVAEGEAKPMMTPPPTPSAPPRAGTEGFEVSNPSWMLDNFEGQSLDWTNVNWTIANPAQLSTVSKDGSKQLLVKMSQGNNDKAAIVRRLPLDLTSRSKLSMDIVNATGEPVMIAIAVETNRFYESRWKSVTMNLSKAVTFDLNTADYKCSPNWQHMQSINNLKATRWLYVLIYRNRPGEIFIDNIQLLGSE